MRKAEGEVFKNYNLTKLTDLETELNQLRASNKVHEERLKFAETDKNRIDSRY